MSFKWKATSDEIARVISKKNIGGIFSKSIIIAPNQRVAIIKNGVVEESVSSGKLRVGGLLKGEINKDVEIAFMDTSPKDLDWISSEMWTSDNQKISCKGLLRFKIYDEQKFFQMIFAYTTPENNAERKLSVQDIYSRLKSETITRVLQPEIRNISIENIYGNREMQLRLENELEMQLKSTFAMWGLELLRYSVEWNLESYKSPVPDSDHDRKGQITTKNMEIKKCLMEIAKKKQTMTYVEFRDVLGLKYTIQVFNILKQISNDCIKNGEPLLSALVVNEDGIPGSGYFESYGEITKAEAKEIHQCELEKVFNWNW